jgi:hypothetical protein
MRQRIYLAYKTDFPKSVGGLFGILSLTKLDNSRRCFVSVKVPIWAAYPAEANSLCMPALPQIQCDGKVSKDWKKVQNEERKGDKYQTQEVSISNEQACCWQ